MLPKLQSIIEFLSLNLSDLCNKISLCNIIDNSAAKNSIKKGRLYKEKENEFVMFMLRRVNKMQPSQSNWDFPDFPPVNRLILPCTTLTTVPCTTFRYFVSIRKPVLRRFFVFP